MPSCYHCGAHVPTNDAIQVADAMDGLVEEGITAVTDALASSTARGRTTSSSRTGAS
jgi:hypothetical protein